jgi:hypothetical protein
MSETPEDQRDSVGDAPADEDGETDRDDDRPFIPDADAGTTDADKYSRD